MSWLWLLLFVFGGPIYSQKKRETWIDFKEKTTKGFQKFSMMNSSNPKLSKNGFAGVISWGKGFSSRERPLPFDPSWVSLERPCEIRRPTEGRRAVRPGKAVKASPASLGSPPLR